MKHAPEARNGPANWTALGRFSLGLLLVGALVAGAVLVIGSWGSGQLYQPSVVQPKLARGMSVREVERALALPSQTLVQRLKRAADGTYRVRLATSGWGCWFVPQYDVTLLFTPGQQLAECSAELHWRIDEVYVPMPL